MSTTTDGALKVGIMPSSIRLPVNLDTALRREAARRGVSRNRLIESALERELFGPPASDEVQHTILTTLLFIEEVVVAASAQPKERLQEVYACKQKQAAALLARE